MALCGGYKIVLMAMYGGYKIVLMTSFSGYKTETMVSPLKGVTYRGIIMNHEWWDEISVLCSRFVYNMFQCFILVLSTSCLDPCRDTFCIMFLSELCLYVYLCYGQLDEIQYHIYVHVSCLICFITPFRILFLSCLDLCRDTSGINFFVHIFCYSGVRTSLTY